jgi:ribosomal protein S18 acetylase RimI-like enzyme
MVIEPVTKNDIVRIADMYFDLYCHVYKRPDSNREKDKLIKYVKDRLGRKDYLIYKAIDHDMIVGTIASKSLNSRRGFITDAYVEPDFRRKGILKTLEEHVLNQFRNQGIKIVELNVRSDNVEGVSTWNALGYQLKKRVSGKKVDKLIMVKEIKQIKMKCYK